MNYLRFKETFSPLVCFTTNQVLAKYPDFSQMNLTRWLRQGYIVRLRRGWFSFPEFGKNPDFVRLAANKIYGINVEPLQGVPVYNPEVEAFKVTDSDGSLLGIFLTDYFQREQVERAVIGLPMQPNGQPSENAARVRSFAGEFRKKFPDIPLDFFDERFTSVIAHRTMLDGGLPMMKRRDKALVDEISACIILQDYMGRRTEK